MSDMKLHDLGILFGIFIGMFFFAFVEYNRRADRAQQEEPIVIENPPDTQYEGITLEFKQLSQRSHR